LIHEFKKMNLSDILSKKPKRFLSIDFNQAYVKVLYLESIGTGVRFLNHDIKKIEFTEHNKPEIVNFIKRFLNDNSIIEKNVHLSIADSDSVIIKHLTLPHLPRQEILSAAKWQLKDIIPDKIESYILDWQIVKEFVDEQGAKRDLLVFVLANRETVNKYVSILSECDIAPISISTGPFNYVNILRHSFEKTESCAILDIGYNDSSICIYKSNKLQFIRRLPYSTDRLLKSFSGTLLSDKGKIELSLEKAAELLDEFGIPQDQEQLLKGEIKAIQIISLIRPIMEQLVRELNLSFEYYTSNNKEETPQVLYIAGSGSGLKNICEYLKKEIEGDVKILPLPKCIKLQGIQQEKVEKNQPYIMSGLGASLTDSSSINLVPKEIKSRKADIIKAGSFRVIAVVSSVIFLFLLLIARLQARDYNARLYTAMLHIEIIREIRVLNEAVEEKEALVSELRKGKIPANGLLKLISTMIPPEITLDELYLDQHAHKLSLKGTITAREQITEQVLTMFMEKMETSPYFIEAALISSVRTLEGQLFEIRVDLAL